MTDKNSSIPRIFVTNVDTNNMLILTELPRSMTAFNQSTNKKRKNTLGFDEFWFLMEIRVVVIALSIIHVSKTNWLTPKIIHYNL